MKTTQYQTRQPTGFVPQEQSAIVYCMDVSGDSQLLQLMTIVVQQDRLAFESVYDQTVSRVFSLALRITHDKPLAEEIISDVYLYVWQNPGRHNAERGSVMAWLTILCRSRCLDALRKSNTRRAYEYESATQTETEQSEFSQNLLLANEKNSHLHRCLSHMQEDQRQLIALAYFRGYSHAQIASFMDMPLGTVKTQIRRGLAKLKMLMNNE